MGFLWYIKITMENNRIQKKGFIHHALSGVLRILHDGKKNENKQTSSHSETITKNDIAKRIEKNFGQALRELAKR